MPQKKSGWDLYETISQDNSQCSLIVEHTGKPLTIYWKNTSNGYMISFEECKFENIKGTFFYDNKPLEMLHIYNRSWTTNSGESSDSQEWSNVSNLPCTTLVNAILNQKILKIVTKKTEPDIWVFKSHNYCPAPAGTPIDLAISISIEYTFDFSNLKCTYSYYRDDDSST
ncbi:hypothetical protein [Floridanema aerugineum]|uniref:Uncharacterized protein n=1 Tax=Floridaenema aerugineum BLCC-F46 TaxID=3153654 RepID=A0ABV4WZW7_9CYAN